MFIINILYTKSIRMHFQVLNISKLFFSHLEKNIQIEACIKIHDF